jgi:hypothetical protein
MLVMLVPSSSPPVDGSLLLQTPVGDGCRDQGADADHDVHGHIAHDDS